MGFGGEDGGVGLEVVLLEKGFITAILNLALCGYQSGLKLSRLPQSLDI